MSKKAVCLISGGLDSCVTAYTAKNQGYEIYALTFEYGQRHVKETECASNIAAKLNSKKHITLKLELDKIGGSSLTDKKIKPEINHKIQEIGETIPNTYVPARNTIFLSIALAFAETIDAEAIYIGVTSADYSGYPDCREEFITAFQKMADLATKKGIEGGKIRIETPLINLSKKEIISKGIKLNAPFENTWSCYVGHEKACGRCDSCLLRLKGFKELGKKDPLNYETYPDWY